ncbi:hypothetical protein BVRB_6g147910 [Beta vulgaris subsp. vulgaris]|nr:hypothetical protein BVRB_6g147910 [Beta vulgaris subsp. vulgaris]
MSSSSSSSLVDLGGTISSSISSSSSLIGNGLNGLISLANFGLTGSDLIS